MASSPGTESPDPWARYLLQQRGQYPNLRQPVAGPQSSAYASGPARPSMSYATTFGTAAGYGNANYPHADASCRIPLQANASGYPAGFSTVKPFPEGNVGTVGSSGCGNFNAASFASALDSSAPVFPGMDQGVQSAFQMLGRPAPPPEGACGSFGRPSANAMSSPQPDVLIAQALNQALIGDKKGVPIWNGNASSLRSWLKLLALWEFESQVPIEKRGVKLLQSFPEGSQPRRTADTVPTQILLSARGYGAILTALFEKYAPFLEASGPQTIDRFLFEGERSKNESFASFIAAKEISRQEMEAQMGERVSDKLCGRILLRQANLTELQREMVMLRGPALRTFDEVANLLRPLDRPEMLARGQDLSSSASRHFFAEDTYLEESDENISEETEPLEDSEGNLLINMEDREYDEEEALAIYAYSSAYRDVRRELQQRRNERGYTKREGRDARPPRHQRPRSDSLRDRRGPGLRQGRDRSIKGQGKGRKGTENDLLMRTRCFGCHELGHLAKDCPLRKTSQAQTSSSPQRPHQRKGFVVVGTENSSASSMAFMLQKWPASIHVYAVTCRASEALVDTAAEDAVIGDQAMKKLQASLKERGLQVIPVEAGTPMPGAGGIGGPAQVLGLYEVPIGVSKVNGVLRFTVLKDQGDSHTPPLLPIKYLESVGAVLDFAQDTYTTRFGSSSTMRRLPTGHRAINILDYDDAVCSTVQPPFRTAFRASHHSLVDAERRVSLHLQYARAALCLGSTP